MSLWRQVKYGVRSLIRPHAVDREVYEEVKHFLDAAVAELVDRGVPQKEAARMVRLKYGTSLAARDEIRISGWENTIVGIVTDLKYGARLLIKNPGFTAVAVLTLGLGIGSATALFSAVNPVLFEPLAYPNAERIVSVMDRAPDGAPVAVTFGTYREIQERSQSFDALAVYRPWQPTMNGLGEPERLDGRRVSAAYLDVLGIRPSLGRGFDVSEDRLNGANVVILSDGFWRRRFGTDPTIVGQSVTLDGADYTIVGVLPAGFEDIPPSRAQVWTLLQYDAALPSFDSREWGHHLSLVGRLRPDVIIDAASVELDRIAANPIPERVRPAWASMGQGLSIRSLKETVIVGSRPVLLALMGAVFLLLTISCINVTSLLLARGQRRRGELTVRTVLGAAGGRLLRQLLTEGLLLTSLGGVLGVLLAQIGIGVIVSLSPAELPRVSAIAMSGSVLVFAVGVTTVVGVLVGLAPALGLTRRDLHGTLGRSSRRVMRGHLSTRRVLVVAEVGLAMVLMVGAGLLLRSMYRLSVVPMGFEPSDMVVMQIQTSPDDLGDDVEVHRFFDQALDAVRQLSGVRFAAMTSQLPLSGDNDVYGMMLDDEQRPDLDRGILRYAVTPGYFHTMGISLARGRFLEETDVASGRSPSVVISESLANNLFSTDPIGRRIHVGRSDLPPFVIVGVVGDVKQTSLGTTQTEAAYMTPGQWYFADRARWLVVQTDRGLERLVPSIKQAIWSVNGDQPIVRIATMDFLVERSEAQRRFALIIFEVFALLALVLAAIGLYGVVSGGVTERMHEIGLRAALGATRESILTLILTQGMKVTVLGVVLGVVGAVAGSSVVGTLLFGVSRFDLVTYVGVASTVLVVSTLACLLPATRASRVDPAQTLRAD